LWNAEKVKSAPAFGATFCSQGGTFSDLRYAVFSFPDKSYVNVQLYEIARGLCSIWSGKQIAIVDVIEPAAMQQKMQVVDAQQMAKSIKSQGRVALYGIYFDSGSASIKSESADELSQIAQLLNQQPTLKLLVVGHTDDAGSYADNVSLSKRRAEAVVAELTSKYKVAANRLQAVGISFASPVASNESEEGKAKNRRVELVPFK
jgi:OOP family OmpA-OmpF porin